MNRRNFLSTLALIPGLSWVNKYAERYPPPDYDFSKGWPPIPIKLPPPPPAPMPPPVAALPAAYVVFYGEGDSIEVFNNAREAAEFSAHTDGRIEEYVLRSTCPPSWTYWHRGAAVYPDGTYDEWEKEHTAEGTIFMDPCDDDHLNRRDEPWDGHIAGHCGEHISIFGTDRALVEERFRHHLATAISRVNGTCSSKYHTHRAAADGVHFYEVGWRSAPRQSRR